MKPFIAIIGEGKSGKSSVIRSLTGVPTTTFRGYMTNLKTGDSILVIASSLQEDHMELGAFQRRITRAVSNDKCRGIVCAIQPNKPIIRNSLEDVMGVAKKFKELELYTFLINPPHGEKSADRSTTDLVNRRLKSFGMKALRLDGNRFPFQNAKKIENTTNLIG